MTYSNTNGDKVQIYNKQNIIYNIFTGIFAVFVAGSALVNISSQYSTLNEAKRKNEKIESDVQELRIKNNKLKMQIEYATSSAFLDQQAREKFGVGNKNDVWINAELKREIDLQSKVNIGDSNPNILRWFNLFTR